MHHCSREQISVDSTAWGWCSANPGPGSKATYYTVKKERGIWKGKRVQSHIIGKAFSFMTNHLSDCSNIRKSIHKQNIAPSPFKLLLPYTAKILYPEIGKKIFPERKLRGLNPNFYIHISVSNLYIPAIGLPIWLQKNRWIDPGNIHINRSQMYEYGNWEQGRAV